MSLDVNSNNSNFFHKQLNLFANADNSHDFGNRILDYYSGRSIESKATTILKDFLFQNAEFLNRYDLSNLRKIENLVFNLKDVAHFSPSLGVVDESLNKNNIRFNCLNIKRSCD